MLAQKAEFSRRLLRHFITFTLLQLISRALLLFGGVEDLRVLIQLINTCLCLMTLERYGILFLRAFLAACVWPALLWIFLEMGQRRRRPVVMNLLLLRSLKSWTHVKVIGHVVEADLGAAYR